MDEIHPGNNIIQNRIVHVGIIGATGNLGRHFTTALHGTGQHIVTAFTRSKPSQVLPRLPAGIQIKTVDYDSHAALVSALLGQQFLIVVLGATAGVDGLHSNIIRAAAEAGVRYIMPNVYGFDVSNEALRREDGYSAKGLALCHEISAAGLVYVVMCCSFWFSWSIALGEWYMGFDIENRRVTFFDDGRTRINMSTFAQCGRSIAALLSLPESSDRLNNDGRSDENVRTAVADWRNQPLYITSFLVSQRDVLDSLNRVLGTTDRDWNITYQSTAARYAEAKELISEGRVKEGRLKMMYSRIFYPTGDGDFQSKGRLDNKALGLPAEDLDEEVRKIVEGRLDF